jgi:hypothetical protein
MYACKIIIFVHSKSSNSVLESNLFLFCANNLSWKKIVSTNLKKRRLPMLAYYVNHFETGKFLKLGFRFLSSQNCHFFLLKFCLATITRKTKDTKFKQQVIPYIILNIYYLTLYTIKIILEGL